MPCDHCPIGDGCRSYPTLCENLAKNPAKWMPVLKRVNAPLEPTSAATVVGMAVESAVGLVASGFAGSGADEAERRHAICRSCPHGLYDAVHDKCKECKCTMRIKAGRLSTKCPKGEW